MAYSNLPLGGPRTHLELLLCPWSGAKYCDSMSVCLSVCQPTYLENYTAELHQDVSARSSTSGPAIRYTSGFVDVMFPHTVHGSMWRMCIHKHLSYVFLFGQKTA